MNRLQRAIARSTCRELCVRDVTQSPFIDGNKRTSLVVAELFVELNGIDLPASDAEAVTTYFQLAASDLTELAHADWIAAHSAAVR